MTAPARRPVAAAPIAPAGVADLSGRRARSLWQDASTIRQEWLGHGLSARPADRQTAGVPLGVVLHQGIRTALHRSLADGFRVPVRAALAGGGPVPVCWYGQQDASWIAYYDALHRIGLARYGADDLDHLGHWAALARSAGWWWPGEEVCVVVDRPEVVRTEPRPGSRHDEVQVQPGGVRYRDGWQPGAGTARPGPVRAAS